MLAPLTLITRVRHWLESLNSRVKWELWQDSKVLLASHPFKFLSIEL